MLSASLSFGENVPNDTITRTKKLKEITVKGYGAERNLNAPEMGKISLSEATITKLPVLFGEPDIVKTLQTQPGVSQGIEGFTGLFVRGGDNDQNMFIYHGLPLYHVSHLGGIFSSFNVASVARVDFYKSAFPAEYGGRISSITDVKMKNPDFENYHGRFNIGLLSANLSITGPIVKDKTAFRAGIRRSWIEVISIPTLAVLNAVNKKKGKKNIASYNFMDFDARIDHKFSNKASARIIGYYGHDYLKIGLREFQPDPLYVGGSSTNYNNPGFSDENTNKFSWGNWGIIGAFNYRTGKSNIEISAYYSDYSSNYRQSREYQSDLSDPSTMEYNLSKTKNSIRDAGIKANYFGEFSKFYNLHAGIGYTHHKYLPEGLANEIKTANQSIIENNGSHSTQADEAYAFVDNTFNFGKAIALNVGLRGVLYSIEGERFTSLEPRASLRILLSKNYSVKMSYANMSQCVQQVSRNFINLPTDLWQPITPRFKPLTSDQYSLGVYGTLPYSMYFSVEGWYKDMNDIIEYREGIPPLDPNMPWEDKLTSGKGWSYGVDLSITKEAGAFTGSIGYGLMWNWRKFADLNQGLKFPSKFDNRHKFNINASYKLNKKIEFNAGWVFMTGNRLTLAVYNYDVPNSFFPDAPSVGYPKPGPNQEMDGLNYIPSRNNIRMPAYHRLDLGMNIYQNLKKGRKGIWNISLYNAYCHMNALTIKKENYNFKGDDNYHTYNRAFKTLGLIPLIPSVSYTFIF